MGTHDGPYIQNMSVKYEMKYIAICLKTTVNIPK
jgi:hypothetical protein